MLICETCGQKIPNMFARRRGIENIKSKTHGLLRKRSWRESTLTEVLRFWLPGKFILTVHVLIVTRRHKAVLFVGADLQHDSHGRREPWLVYCFDENPLQQVSVPPYRGKSGKHPPWETRYL